MKRFSKMQETAILHPCEYAHETTQPMFARYQAPWSIVLTVNVGKE